MNKTEFIQKLAKITGLSQVKSAEVVGALFDGNSGIIASELEKGRRVSVPGFGTFQANHRKARDGRNPATGKSIRIPAKKYPAFKAGKTLKDRVAK